MRCNSIVLLGRGACLLYLLQSQSSLLRIRFLVSGTTSRNVSGVSVFGQDSGSCCPRMGLRTLM